MRNLSQRRRRRRRRLGHDDDGTAPLLLIAPPHPSSTHQLPRPYLLLLPWGRGGWARGDGGGIGERASDCHSRPNAAQLIAKATCCPTWQQSEQPYWLAGREARKKLLRSCTTKRKNSNTKDVVLVRDPHCPHAHWGPSMSSSSGTCSQRQYSSSSSQAAPGIVGQRPIADTRSS